MDEITVLNVDDNPVSLYAKSRILRFAGYQVIESSTGTHAIEQAQDEQPSIILLDVNLPDISGFEVCKRLRNNTRTREIPILMTSAIFNRGADRARGIEGGADGYLTEPVEPEVVQATIESIIRSRKAEALITEAATQWRTTFRAITDGVALLDNDEKILRSNPAFETLTDLKEDQFLGKTFRKILEQWGIKENVQEMLRFNTRQQLELLVNERWLLLTLDPVFEHEVRRGSVCILSDITARKRYEEDLNQARQTAEAANAAKDQFLAVLSHELRTPLTPVLTLIEALRMDDDLPEYLSESLEIIHRNVNLEARLIDDLLDLTRISKGKIGLDTERVDMHRLIFLVLEICKPDIDLKKLETRLALNAKHSMVLGDPARLQQILWNLVKNAVKFTPIGGSIRIATQNKEGKLWITVTDSGIGMEPDVLLRVFNAFEQGDKKITQQFGGLGLGLAISKNLAELHGGAILAESDGKGTGSTFSLILNISE